ncbi:MAG: hypothetical protein CSA07_03110 [Bacteroidia bacterium]|nr:MAG: hypothetical protein CSA07_03110 [Bacteroidia bacterium]
MKRIFPSILLLLPLLLPACGERPLQADYREMPDQGWAADSVCRFELEPTDQPADLFIYLQHASTYPNANLYLFIEAMGPDSVLRQDTLNYHLASPTGEWYGRGLSSQKKLLLPYVVAASLAGKQPYRIAIKHGMRYEVLPGIREIGVQVFPHTPPE